MGEKQKAYLSKADFLAAITGKIVDYDLDGLGTIQIRPLNVEEAAEIRGDEGIQGDGIEIGIRAVLLGVVEPRLSREDTAAIRRASVAVFNDLSRRIMALSGLSEDSEDDELKNSVGGGSSSNGAPPPS